VSVHEEIEAIKEPLFRPPPRTETLGENHDQKTSPMKKTQKGEKEGE